MLRYLLVAWVLLVAGCGQAPETGSTSPVQPLLARTGDNFTVELRSGWNAVAFQAPKIGSVSGPAAGVVTYEAGSYRTASLTPETVNAGAGTGRGFWVYATGGGNLTYQESEGSAAPVALSAGWNLVAFPQAEAVSASALRVTQGAILVYQLALDGTATAVSLTTGTVQPGRPCWIYASTPAQLSWSGTPAPTSSALQVAIFTHNEDPHHPAYPDFVADKTSYKNFRSSLLEFAREMKSRNLAWNWQSDWNFLNAVILYEIEQPDAELLAATEGKNVVVYLRDLGVEIDPHSHENDGYNYADVAYLISRTGVQPAPVVGGHIYDPTEAGYQNWPRFASGLKGSRYPDYIFKPSLLSGAGTGNHRRDPTVTGMWRPNSATDFFTHNPTGALTCFGGWDGNLDRIDQLLRLLDGGALPAGMATAAFMFNSSDLAQPGFLQSTVIPRLNTLVSLRDSGRVQVVRFTDALAGWNPAQASVYPTGNDMVSFSLNVQDFSYPDRSAALLTRALDLHERLHVPVDVFLTSTQAEIFAASYPALLERLKTSRLATVSYHVRAPKPYANSYDWLGLARRPLSEQVSTIANYEAHVVDLVTGQPTAEAGGYTQLKALLGYPPMMIGSGEPTLFQASAQVFAGLGANLAVEHSGTVNLGEQKFGLALRPEHVDLRLFEEGYANQSGQAILDAAVAQARTASGATAPYFTGVKMHDNDFFAVDSAWLTVYLNGGRRTPPWDITRKSTLLSDAEQAAMWARYEAVVTYAASLRNRVNLVSAPVLQAMQPQR